MIKVFYALWSEKESAFIKTVTLQQRDCLITYSRDVASCLRLPEEDAAIALRTLLAAWDISIFRVTEA